MHDRFADIYHLGNEFIQALVGKPLGEGRDRKVFELPITGDDWIVKFQVDEHRHFQNVVEWDAWKDVKDTPYARWFAPVNWISPNGQVLIMRKTKIIGHHELPKFVPTFFCDLKRENWGMLDGKPVCHDYGTHFIKEKGLTNRVRKAEWRE